MNHQLNPEKYRDLVALRTQLESFAARRVATEAKTNPATAREIDTVFRTLHKTMRKPDYEQFRKTDMLFHKSIVSMAKMPLMDTFWQQTWDALTVFHQHCLENYFLDWRTLMDEHEYLAHTISHADPVAAEDAARSHLEAVWQRVAEKHFVPGPESTPLQRAIAHMGFRMRSPLRLTELAKTVSFTSAGNLSRQFKERYGVSFQGFLQNMRMEKAAELLAQTDLSVERIAQRVGYRALSRFGQHFKRKHGFSPLKWRNSNNISSFGSGMGKKSRELLL